jgi:hypothetical protein
LSVVWDGDAVDDGVLLKALDRLVMAYHETPDVAPSNSDLEAPRECWKDLYEKLGKRFPEMGLYPAVDPTGALGGDAGVGDAIDDLADLTLDMREVVWLAENVGIDDAQWMFRLQYLHWGTHARELANYLHARQFG